MNLYFSFLNHFLILIFLHKITHKSTRRGAETFRFGSELHENPQQTDANFSLSFSRVFFCLLESECAFPLWLWMCDFPTTACLEICENVSERERVENFRIGKWERIGREHEKARENFSSLRLRADCGWIFVFKNFSHKKIKNLNFFL